jgi:hypothetical protein
VEQGGAAVCLGPLKGISMTTAEIRPILQKS